MYNELIAGLKARGADLIKTADISQLSEQENRGYKAAVLIGVLLSPEYISRQLNKNTVDFSEYVEKEHRADELSEWAAGFLFEKGYDSFAQSTKNLINGCFDEKTKTTSLPHKKIAVLPDWAGLGKTICW